MLPLAAQGGADKLKTMVTTKRVIFDYTLTPEVKGQVKLSGSAIIDGNCYLLSGNGFGIYCDGSTKWTVDGEAKEVYIENAGGMKDILSDPAQWLDNVTDLKVSDKTVTGTYADPSSGEKMSFRFSSIYSFPLSGSTEGFVLDTKTLGKDWVITDLR